jgi:hypothetical protein
LSLFRVGLDHDSGVVESALKLCQDEPPQRYSAYPPIESPTKIRPWYDAWESAVLWFSRIATIGPMAWMVSAAVAFVGMMGSARIVRRIAQSLLIG